VKGDNGGANMGVGFRVWGIDSEGVNGGAKMNLGFRVYGMGSEGDNGGAKMIQNDSAFVHGRTNSATRVGPVTARSS